ncbi:hypothetical protein CJI97_004905 [Candidozyma auris]|nr:hypothetical protein CJI97_004905 [[Candida] auris]
MSIAKKLIPLAVVAALVLADDMDMDMDEKVEFHPVNAGSKTFHWITTLFLLLILPSVSSVLAFAEVFHLASVFHIVSLAYSALESLFLDFPDNVDNHENRTSKGTSWFLTWELAATVFLGTLINGSNIVMNKFWPQKAQSFSTSSRMAIRAYKTVAFTSVLTGWVRVCMAPVALFGFCYGKATGQCIAHGIMGSSFILYGFVLAWVLTIPWIRNHRRLNGDPNVKSQEFWDSTIMCLWGIVNTFTEHRWGREEWNHGDYQHTSMGIIWWCGGLLGMWLSRKNNTRSVVPALLLIYTGWAMSEHSQHLVISTKVHGLFGLVLMSGGLSRIVEICFLLNDNGATENGKILTFQHIPPFSLVLSGILFMSANEEQLNLVHDLGADHSSYILVVSGAGFLIYLWMQMLLTLYLHLVGYDENGELSKLDGYANITSDDVDNFELDDLSDEDPRETTA